MFYEILRFEIQYRARRAETYLYFVVLFVCSLFAVDFIFQGTGSKMNAGAPYAIAFSMAVMSALFTLIVSMIMGVSVLRDFEHRMESLMFVNPIKKAAYLLGRFLGSFVVLLFVFSAMIPGMMIGTLMHGDALSFNLVHYVSPFVNLVLPTLVFTASLFFVTGALSRKYMIVYTQGILLLVFYLLVSIAASESEGKLWSALFDPFAINTINHVVKDSTLTERQTLTLPWVEVLVMNRVMWVCAGVLVLAWGYWRFRFDVVRESKVGTQRRGACLSGRPGTENLLARATNTFLANKKSLAKPQSRKNASQAGNKFAIGFHTKGTKAQSVFFAASRLCEKKLRAISPLLHHSLFHLFSLLRETPFIAITISAAAIIFVNGISLGTSHGVDSYPTTYLIVEELQEMSVPFFLIILIFYSGELVWKERQARMNLIYDALPVSNFVMLTSKFIGLIFAYGILLLVLCLAGIALQTFNGYHHYDLPVYAVGFFGEVWVFLILYTFVSFLLHVIINHKFMAQLATMLFVIVTLGLEAIGYDHDLLRFGGDRIGTYSEMNGYGHLLAPYAWIKTYWLSLGVLMLIIAGMLLVRGADTQLAIRWQRIKSTLSKPVIVTVCLLVTVFISSGGYVFYNTNVLNQYYSQHDEETMQANYEKKLKQFEYMPSPQIVGVDLKLDLYPHECDYILKGQFTLVNNERVTISEIHLQKVPDSQITLEAVTFSTGATRSKAFDRYGYSIYTLHQALNPGDSVVMTFTQRFETSGFPEGNSNTDVVYNGTLLRNSHFPSIGYNRYFELTDEDLRKDHHLPPRPRRAKMDDPHELKNGGAGGDGYEINFDIVVSTDAHQIAVAPGNLDSTWIDNGRSYFHYRMYKPMINFYSIVSAEYTAQRDRWSADDPTLTHPVDLEIYHHHNHTKNLDRMMHGMKASLQYYSKHFGPYPYDQLRIMEFPRYREFAQSLPGTIPFSEAVGFILNIDDTKDVDMAFYVTAHEVAHQWWGMQLVAANVEGRDMILESLAQYSAIMVLKENYGQAKVDRFLDTQRKEYLKGRASVKEEEPLALVTGDPYIYYNKGALAMYALQTHISEEKVNLALKRFMNDWNAFGGKKQHERYATTKDLLEYFREAAPDSVVRELFEK